MASADLIIGCDPIVVAGKETLARMRGGRTHVALNSNSPPTAAFVKSADWVNPGAQCLADIGRVVGPDHLGTFDADALAVQVLGDAIYTNPMMLGYAWQKGWIPLLRASLMRAIELNAVAVDNNRTAFDWGCRAAVDPAAVLRLLQPAQVIAFTPRPKTGRAALDASVQFRADFLTQYQNAAYAEQYSSFVATVRAAESALGAGDALPLSEAVARYLFKLMAYKDEYEVARLQSDAGFKAKLQAQFQGDYQLHYHLAPPLFAKRNEKGELQKQQFGAWMGSAMRVLAKLRFLRGTAFDPFGRSEERHTERALITEYRSAIEAMLPTLNASNRDAAAAFARVPEQIRGFGHVKARHLQAARQQWALLRDRYDQPQAQQA
jgi:indolepyruvate ferredoxin oxidoreductase